MPHATVSLPKANCAACCASRRRCLSARPHLSPMIAEFAHRHPQLQITTAYRDRVRGSHRRRFRPGDSPRLATGLDAGGAAHRPDDGQDGGDSGLHRGAWRAAVARRNRETSGAHAGHGRSGVCATAIAWWRCIRRGDSRQIAARLWCLQCSPGSASRCCRTSSIGEHIASGALVTLLPQYPMPEAGLYVVRPPGEHPPRKVRVFTDFLAEQLAARCNTAPAKPGIP